MQVEIDVVELLGGNKAEKTVEMYTIMWRQYLEFAGDLVTALRPETLARWRQNLVTETDFSPNTINLKIKAVKAVVRAAAERRLVPRTAALELRDIAVLPHNALRERKRPHNRVRISSDQMRTICNKPEIDLFNELPTMHRALLLTLATSGMRASEAVAMRIEDIVVTEKGILVQNILGKGQGEARVAPLGKQAYAAIQDWLEIRPLQSPYVFVAYVIDEELGLLYSEQHMSPKRAYDIVKRYARQAGMKHVKPHDFRRFVGTQLARTNLRTAQKVLGHKSIATTAQFYVLDEVEAGITDDLL